MLRGFFEFFKRLRLISFADVAWIGLLGIAGLWVFVLVGGIGTSIYYCYTASHHPAQCRYTLSHQGKIKKCLVEFPRYRAGKLSYWGGSVNLVNCEDHTDIFGATNVSVLNEPQSAVCKHGNY